MTLQEREQMATKVCLATLKSAKLTEDDFQSFVDILADIYIENCGLSMGARTVAYDSALALIGQYKKMDFIASAEYFTAILDQKNPTHKDYDVGPLSDEEFNAIFIRLCDSWPKLKALIKS